MRTVSKSRSADDREAKAADMHHCAEMHELYAGSFCWWCRRLPGREVHHIAGEGVGVRNADGIALRDHRTGLMWLCPKCHSDRVPTADRLNVFAIRSLHEGWDEEIAKELHRGKDGRTDWFPDWWRAAS